MAMPAVLESVPSQITWMAAVRPACQVAGKTVVDPQDDLHRAAVDEVLHPPVVVHLGHNVEIAAGGEAGQKLAAGRGVVQIVNRRADVADVHVHRVADHQHLHAGHDEDHGPHPRVAKDLDELLDQHLADTLEHGGSAWNLGLRFVGCGTCSTASAGPLVSAQCSVLSSQAC